MLTELGNESLARAQRIVMLQSYHDTGLLTGICWKNPISRVALHERYMHPANNNRHCNTLVCIVWLL